MKRFISFLLVAILIVTSLSVMASATQPGDTVTIPVTVSGNFVNFLISINADPGLTILSISGTSVVNGPNSGKANWAGASNVDSYTVDVTVQVAEDIAPGKYCVTGVAERASTKIAIEEDTDGIVDGLTATSVTVSGGCIVIEEPKCDHDYQLDKDTYKAGDCRNKGYEKWICTKCGDSYVVEELGDHKIKSTWDHDMKTHWHECEVCGEKFNEADHDMQQETIKPASKTEDGLKRHFCTVCTYEYEEILPKDLDEVPGTGDITPVIVLGAVALIAMMGASLFVFKRKATK